jgi:hypothetical protein
VDHDLAGSPALSVYVVNWPEVSLMPILRLIKSVIKNKIGQPADRFGSVSISAAVRATCCWRLRLIGACAGLRARGLLLRVLAERYFKLV